MPTSRQKRVARETGVPIPSRHEWSGLLYRKGDVTREGKFKTWQEARQWVVYHLRMERQHDAEGNPTSPYTDITLAEVCHVEKNDEGKAEDVAVIRFMPQYGTWTEQQRKKPWFQGQYSS